MPAGRHGAETPGPLALLASSGLHGWRDHAALWFTGTGRAASLVPGRGSLARMGS